MFYPEGRRVGIHYTDRGNGKTMTPDDDGVAHNRSGQTASDNPRCANEGKDPRDNPAHYVLRIFYYNPGDPAMMVPMRWGSGIDFNYARWPGKTVATIVATLVIYTLLSTFL